MKRLTGRAKADLLKAADAAQGRRAEARRLPALRAGRRHHPRTHPRAGRVHRPDEAGHRARALEPEVGQVLRRWARLS